MNFDSSVNCAIWQFPTSKLPYAGPVWDNFSSHFFRNIPLILHHFDLFSISFFDDSCMCTQFTSSIFNELPVKIAHFLLPTTRQHPRQSITADWRLLCTNIISDDAMNSLLFSVNDCVVFCFVYVFHFTLIPAANRGFLILTFSFSHSRNMLMSDLEFVAFPYAEMRFMSRIARSLP